MGRAARWTRREQLLAEGSLIVVGGLATADALFTLVMAVRREPIDVTVELDPPVGLAALGTAATTVTTTIAEPSPGAALLHAAPVVVLLLAAAGVAWLLLGLTRSLRSGAVFTAANAHRLRAVGLLVAFGGVAWTGLDSFAQLAASSAVADATGGAASPVVVGAHFTWLPFVLAWPVFVLAEVLSRGMDLRAEVDGLV